MDKHLPSSEAFSKALAHYQPISRRHAAILKDWREDSSRGDLWRAFQSAYALQSAAVKQRKPLPEPADFIGDVLGCTLPASRLNKHSKHVVKQFEKLKREIDKVVKDADRPLDLLQDLQRFEKRLWELDRSDYPTDQPAGGRKDQNGSQDHRLFAETMFRYLQNACGQHLASEVIKMLHIVFPDAEHEESVIRSWLPKTRKPFV
jgi:hypothetical protein